jgi:hypothetical protein
MPALDRAAPRPSEESSFAERTLMSIRLINPVAAVLGALLVLATVAPGSAQTESPPIGNAGTILGNRANGPNYQVEQSVRSDGFLQVFTLATPYGRYQVEGRDMLELRLGELAAVTALEHMSKSQEFVQAAAKAAMRPVGVVTNMISNPGSNIESTMTGVGNLFSRLGSNIANAGHNPDRPAQSALGVTAAKRQIAFHLGVDPYTDFKPLADSLTEAARVAALGNLAVGAAFMAIPNPARAAVSAAKTTQELGQLVRDKTPSELRDLNRSRLAGMGVPDRSISAFLDNTFFTPSDQTAFVAAMAKLGGVTDRHLFVIRASQAPNRDLAYFIRRRAELLADYHTRVEPLTAFVDLRGFPLNQTRSGKVLALIPVDELAWTKEASGVVDVIDRDVKARKLGSVVELRTSGALTPLARKSMTERGWKVVEHVVR